MPARQPHPQLPAVALVVAAPKFPIGILQRGLKMTTEPPKGLKANMTRLCQQHERGQVPTSSCGKPHKYKKLLYAMCWFHAVLVDRRKFLNLGWNIPYDFNDSDFEVSELCLRLYLDEYDETPWDALKYLISEINYGGRVTDDLDRRLMNVYMASFFNEDALNVPNFRLSSLPNYVIPEDGPLSASTARSAPACRRSTGRRPSASTRTPTSPRRSPRATRCSRRSSRCSRAPPTRRASRPRTRCTPRRRPARDRARADQHRRARRGGEGGDGSALHVVLIQELQRYNALLGKIRKSLVDVRKGIKGWWSCRPSSTRSSRSCAQRARAAVVAAGVPVAQAARLVVARPRAALGADDGLVRQGPPKVFWLAGFTYPNGFLTALMQTSARANNVSIDTLMWDFPVSTSRRRTSRSGPKDGAYVKGLFLEGAGWNYEHSCLCEPEPMELKGTRL